MTNIEKTIPYFESEAEEAKWWFDIREELDVLGFTSVDAGCGWLIFALLPGEATVHPSENGPPELYFMCTNLQEEIAALQAKGVPCSSVREARWGSITKMTLPGGGEIGLYQPKHPLAISIPSA